ncbi:MAG: LAGLIDADG family homing endonuclease, partial [Zestosphaera sp.]
EVVYRLKPREIASFLKGLFIASRAVGRGSAIRLTSASFKPLKSVQELLLLFGIMSRIREHGNNGGELLIERNSREIFVEKIGFVSGRTGPTIFREVRTDPPLATLDSVEYLGEEEVFDTEVPGYHYYVAGGFISHNCGEEPLLEWESCNLGSLNLEKYVVYIDGKPTIDWTGLGRDVRVAVRFLDNVIDVAKWPLPQLERSTKRTRKVGLGVMGWAHMLVRLGIPFDSVDALYLAYYLSEWIAYNAYKASIELAAEKGTFPAWDPELYRPFWLTTKSFDELLEIAGIEPRVSERIKTLVKMRPQVNWSELREEMIRYGLRNAALLSIAPTGTISIIAGTSSSIEPVFALAFTRVVTVGTFVEVNTLFLDALREYGLDDPEVINLIAESGSIRHNPYMPKKLKEIFVTAHDIEPSWHVLHQAMWQQWVDAGVSKTVNMRAEVSVDDVRNVYLLAWKLGCKGITIYRDKSKTQQVIYFGAKLTRRMARERKAEGVAEVTPETTRKESEAAESTSRTSESTLEVNRRTQARYRIATRYVLQEGESGDCFTCEY